MIEVKEEQFLSLAELSAYLGIATTEGLRKWRKRNCVQCYKVGRRSYVRKSDVENALLNAPAADRGQQAFIVRQEGGNTCRYLTVDKNGNRSSLRVTYLEGSVPSRDVVRDTYQRLRGESTDLPGDLLAAIRKEVGDKDIINAVIG